MIRIFATRTGHFLGFVVLRFNLWFGAYSMETCAYRSGQEHTSCVTQNDLFDVSFGDLYITLVTYSARPDMKLLSPHLSN